MKTVTLQTARCVMNATGKKATVHIYGQIGKDFWSNSGIDPKEFNEELENLGDVDVLEVRIHSYGGYVYEGMAIITALRRHKAEKHVFVDGIAASMASAILMVGDKRYAAKNSTIMIHDPLSFCVGNLTDMQRCAAMLEKTKDQLLDLYAEKCSLSRDDISQKMTDETFMTSAEALEWGFVDAIGDEVENDSDDHASNYDSAFRIAASKDFAKIAPFLAFSKPSGDPEHDEEEDPMGQSTAAATPGAESVAGNETTQAEAVKNAQLAERKRVKDIQDMSQPGVEDLVAKFVDDGTSAGDAALEINKALRAKSEKDRQLNSRRNAGNALVTDDGTGEEVDTPAADDFKAQWAANTGNCRDEFLSEAAFIAFKNHQAKGLTKITSRKQ